MASFCCYYHSYRNENGGDAKGRGDRGGARRASHRCLLLSLSVISLSLCCLHTTYCFSPIYLVPRNRPFYPQRYSAYYDIPRYPVSVVTVTPRHHALSGIMPTCYLEYRYKFCGCKTLAHHQVYVYTCRILTLLNTYVLGTKYVCPPRKLRIPGRTRTHFRGGPGIYIYIIRAL